MAAPPIFYKLFWEASEQNIQYFIFVKFNQSSKWIHDYY